MLLFKNKIIIQIFIVKSILISSTCPLYMKLHSTNIFILLLLKLNPFKNTYNFNLFYPSRILPKLIKIWRQISPNFLRFRKHNFSQV
jgi:hypothetical protein